MAAVPLKGFWWIQLRDLAGSGNFGTIFSKISQRPGSTPHEFRASCDVHFQNHSPLCWVPCDCEPQGIATDGGSLCLCGAGVNGSCSDRINKMGRWSFEG